MPVDPEPLRRLVDHVLLSKLVNIETEGFRKVCDVVQQLAERERVSFDSAPVVEYWWHLARTGMIALTGESKPAIQMGGVRYPNFIVTERGRALLEQGQDSPHDPRRYLSAIVNRVNHPDDIVLTYVNEAVGAWSNGLYRASAVMLGGACERLIDMVADVIAKKNTFPKSAALATKLNDPNASISGIFADVRETLLNANLPRDLKDRLDRHLSPIFDHARKLRNRTGHPTGEVITSEDAQSGLLLFPGFYELTDKIMKAL